MHLLLYIGHHKVGSTSLQQFLAQNFHRLAAAGILYPFTELQGAARALAAALGADPEGTGLPVNIREPHSALAYRMMADVAGRPVPPQFQMLPHSGQMLYALRQQLRFVRPRAVVLCSEAFANFGAVDPGLIDRLLNQFPEAEPRVYCALRRPDEYVVSWHGQRLKVGEQVAPLRDGGARIYYPTIHFDFRRVVEAWFERLPGAAVLRNYADVVAAGGSEADFLAASGLDFPAGLAAAPPANPSLPHALHEIVRRANAALPTADRLALIRFLLAAAPRLALPPNHEVEMLGVAQRAEMYERFAPVHDYLSRAAGRPAFFPDIEEMRRARPLPEAEAMAAALAALTPEAVADLASEPARDLLEALRAEFRGAAPGAALAGGEGSVDAPGPGR